MTGEPERSWRTVLLAGLAAGLAGAPLLGAPGGGAPWVELGAPVAAAAILAAARPRGIAAGLAWSACLGLAALVAGLSIGEQRLEAIDAGALEIPSGSAASLEGFVTSYPRRSRGVVRFPMQAAGGRVSVRAREPVPDLSPGDAVRITGTIAEPEEWYAPYLEQNGIARVVRADSVRADQKAPGRGGLSGWLDGIRSRAEDGIAAGMRSREAGIALGFVLGRVDTLGAATHESFRRSGLAHLLAVSGQNVMLLVILAWLPLGAMGLAIRWRVPVVLALIAIYVPLAGAGPSIQRAGVMGMAGLLALWAGRRHSRAFGLLAAAAGTLLLNPRAAGTVGWQLSFAAVAGIFATAPGLRSVLRTHLARHPALDAVVDGAAITVAATLATAPLLIHHFGALPVGTLTANLLAMPAVAVSMWLGMSAAAFGQLPFAPTEIPNQVNEVLLAYIAELAAAIARPDWAFPEVRLESPALAAALTGVTIAAPGLVIAAMRRRWRAGLPTGDGEAGGGLRAERARAWQRRAATVMSVAVVAAPIAAGPAAEVLPGGRGEPEGLRIAAMDVDQGDAILLQAGSEGAILVDTGPPGEGIARSLGSFGADRLDAVLLTHADEDHAGGLRELIGAVPIGTVLHGGALGGEYEAATAAASVPTRRVTEGTLVRLGDLRLEILWPRPSSLATGRPSSTSGPGASSRPSSTDSLNASSVVALARWDGYRALLAGDAEAEAVPLYPGPLDLLKVAHHGSADAGLDGLLRRTKPEVGVISAGEGNPFGHPAPETLQNLEAHDVEVRRTDLEGDVVIELPPPT